MTQTLAVPEDHEELIHCNRPRVGLHAIVCIDNTTLGPACGGTRFYPYATYEDAKHDALRLARAMTYKGAMLWPQYHVGGGKAVIIGDPAKTKTAELLRAYGGFIEKTLAGRFLTGEDMGCSVVDVEQMHTRFALGKSESHGGGGNPATMTALGCLYGIRAAMQLRFGSRRFTSHVGHPRTLVFQGLGEVGFRLARLAKQNGARIVACDANLRAVERVQRELGAATVPPEQIYETAGDVFVPCARGGILNADTIPRLQCPIVAGSANNQFADPDTDSALLHNRDILHVPDYVINAGGLINIADEAAPGGYNETRARRNTERIYDRVFAILAKARDINKPPQVVADAMCRHRIAGIAMYKELSTSNENIV